MKLDGLLDALALPASCRVDQRVPKKMLVDNGAPTATDKRLLTDAILTGVVRDCDVQGKWKLASEQAAVADLKNRVFVDEGEIVVNGVPAATLLVDRGRRTAPKSRTKRSHPCPMSTR